MLFPLAQPIVSPIALLIALPIVLPIALPIPLAWGAKGPGPDRLGLLHFQKVPYSIVFN